MSDLPSFLQQTGPHAYTLTFSASGADTFSLCKYKFAWAYITRIEAAVARAGQNYGTAIHLLLSALYRELQDGKAFDPGAILAKHFAEHPQPELGKKGRPEFRTAARALQAFEAYRAAYPAEDFEVLGVEEPFEVVLGAFEVTDPKDGLRSAHVTVKFRGIRDLRVRWHDSLWVLDHKSSTEWSDLTVDEGKASFQFMGYGWVERFLNDQGILDGERPPTPVGGVIGNYIISREPYADPNRKPSPRDLPRDQFERQAYPYSDVQLDEWHSRAMGIARELWRHWREEEWPQNSTACAHWGRCEYYRLCWETDPAYRMAAALSADFRERTPSPFEEIENGKERA